MKRKFNNSMVEWKSCKSFVDEEIKIWQIVLVEVGGMCFVNDILLKSTLIKVLENCYLMFEE